MPEEPKLHIDEDWKSQVEREKQQWKDKRLSPELQPANELGSSGSAAERVADEIASADASRRHLPPASMMLLITTLGSQAMMALGAMPGEDGKPTTPDLELAKHFIDLLGVLEDKTRNNLASDESSYLAATLYQLRLLYVERRK